MTKKMKDTGAIHSRIIVTKGTVIREMVLTTNPNCFDLHAREGTINAYTKRVSFRYWHHQICYSIMADIEGSAHDVAEHRAAGIITDYRDAGYAVTVTHE